MAVTIENIDNPLKIFSAQISLVESYINNIICMEDPEAKLTCSSEDFELLDELAAHAYSDTPEDIKEMILQGVTFAFSEILTKYHDLKWCTVLDGPFPRMGMRRGSESNVIYLRDMIDKYAEVTDEISFSNIHNNIITLLETADSQPFAVLEFRFT